MTRGASPEAPGDSPGKSRAACGPRDFFRVNQALALLAQHDLAQRRTDRTGGRDVERWFATMEGSRATATEATEATKGEGQST